MVMRFYRKLLLLTIVLGVTVYAILALAANFKYFLSKDEVTFLSQECPAAIGNRHPSFFEISGVELKWREFFSDQATFKRIDQCDVLPKYVDHNQSRQRGKN